MHHISIDEIADDGCYLMHSRSLHYNFLIQVTPTHTQLNIDTSHLPKCHHQQQFHTHSKYPQHQKISISLFERKKFKCTKKGTFNVIQQPISKRNLLFVAVAFGSSHTSRSLWFLRSKVRPACKVGFSVAKGEEGRGSGAIVGEDKEARHSCHSFVTTPLTQQACLSSRSTRERRLRNVPFPTAFPSSVFLKQYNMAFR